MKKMLVIKNTLATSKKKMQRHKETYISSKETERIAVRSLTGGGDFSMFTNNLSNITMFKPLTLAEIEFSNSGPFSHLCTEPVEDDVLFRTHGDYVLVNNIIAIAVFLAGIRLLAYAIMDNPSPLHPGRETE